MSPEDCYYYYWVLMMKISFATEKAEKQAACYGTERKKFFQNSIFQTLTIKKGFQQLFRQIIIL